MRPAILDFEASGFGHDSYLIEVGVALPDGRKYCSLIVPPLHWTHWNPAAERVHCISRSMLARHGRPLVQVVEELNAFVGGGTVYSDGWVVDDPWWRKLHREAGIEPCYRLSALEMILDQAQMERWQTAKNAVLAELGAGRHRASFDAYVIQETFWRTHQSRAA